LLAREFTVAQDARQQAEADCLTDVDTNRRGASVAMAKPVVTAFDANQ